MLTKNFAKPSSKRTKIVATIGPASYDEEVLRKMIRSGMNVARINFSHGDYATHAHAIQTIRRLAEEEGKVVAILGDLQGPKIRLGNLGELEPLNLAPGDTLTLTARSDPDPSKLEINLPHPEFIVDVDAGQRLLLDDGEIEFRVVSKEGQDLLCEVMIGGKLKSRKGVMAPDSRLTLPALTDKDREDLVFALDQKIDWLAMSFVRSADEMRELRWLIKQHRGDVATVAKIEKSEALENIDAIIEASDGIMVARGDLGLEIPAASVPIEQKRIIQKCNAIGKPVITATQMLNSMIHSPRPTRAEASDVANAIFDGTDAVMLSGESASGDFPVESVETMATIAQIAESHLALLGRIHANVGARASIKDGKDGETLVADAISHATVEMAQAVDAKMIVTCTWTGYTARRVARERPATPILCITPNGVTYQRMALVWGVRPMLVEEFFTIDDMLKIVVRSTREAGLTEPGDRIVIISGVPFGAGGHTNFVKIQTITE